MLIVQPTSTCDVCLERYVWDATEPDSKPHVISCGHVFCQRCLQNLRIPRTCPLCRAAFHLARAVRVHIDLASDEPAQVALTPEEQTARDFEERLGQASADDAAGSACRAIVDEALGWLEGVPVDQHQTLRASLSLLDRYKELSENLQSAQDAAQRMREERDHYRRNLRRSERGREQEKILQQGHDEQWASKVSEIERECEKCIAEAETHRQNLEDELERCKRTLAAQLDAQAEAEAIVQAEAEAQARAQAQSVPRPPSAEAQVPQFPPNTQASANHQAQTVGVVFPRASRSPEPYLSYFTEPEPYEFAHNPLPRPPEPVPLARLPAFARPRPGSRAYEAARVLARTGRLKGKERDKDKDKEKRKEKEAGRDSGRESGRERDGMRERKREGALSGTERERDRQLRREKHRERERGTDTSATETQERSAEGGGRRRSRHSLATSTVPVPVSTRVLSAAPTIVGQSSSGDRTIRPEGDMSANESVAVNGNAEGRARAVVGGWGLERSWRASLGSSTGSVSDLRAELGRAGSGETRAGSSHTRAVKVEKGKERERNSELEQKQDRVGDRLSDRERERPRDRNGDIERDEATDADDQGYVFVRLLPDEQQRHEKDKDQIRRVETTQAERRRSIAHPTSTYSTSSALSAYADASRQSEKTRERRTTLSAIPQGATLRPPIGEPSALGLTLVPSPSGSGYEHAYRAAYPPQSSIQIGSATGSASGRESVRQTPSYPYPASSVNPQTGSSTYAHSYQRGSSYYPERPLSRRGSSPTLARRATEPHLHTQAQAQAQENVVSVAAAVPRPSTLARASSTALHVPQPRRISTHIPEPEPEPETETDRTPAPPQTQSQTQAQPFQHPAAYSSTYSNPAQNPGIDQLYENPNMSLDSALARLTLASQQSRDQLRQQQQQHQTQTQNYGHGQQGHEQTLRHKTSTASSASTSTSISLMGTSGERRKQLLDALFTAPASGTSASANASLVSLGQTMGADVVQVEPIVASTESGTGVAAGATASTRTAVATDRLRGVPSVDGRPSRALSTRPSTVNPTQYTVRPVESHAQTAHTHVRQTTYPLATYPTYATSTGVPTHQAAPSPYAQYPNPNFPSSGVNPAVYAPANAPGTYVQYPTSASISSTDANAYAAYYQAQQLQAQSQAVSTVGTGANAVAGATSAGYMSASGDYPHTGAYVRSEMKARR